MSFRIWRRMESFRSLRMQRAIPRLASSEDTSALTINESKITRRDSEGILSSAEMLDANSMSTISLGSVLAQIGML